MTEVKTVSSQDFMVPVAAVLKGAADFVEVVVIGIDGDGEVQVASSMGTPQTIALINRAKPRIEELRED